MNALNIIRVTNEARRAQGEHSSDHWLSPGALHFDGGSWESKADFPVQIGTPEMEMPGTEPGLANQHAAMEQLRFYCSRLQS